MSAYFTPIEYLSQPQLDPRTRYLTALQQVRAAEAEYLAAEAIQREEAALRQRLYEIQLQKPARYGGINIQQQVAPIRTEVTQRQLAIEAARRLLAEEEEKTRQRRAEEEELKTLVRRIEQQRHERLLVDRRIQEAQRQAVSVPILNWAMLTFIQSRQTTAAKVFSTIVNQTTDKQATCSCEATPPSILLQPKKAPEAPKQEASLFHLIVSTLYLLALQSKSLKEQLEARLYSDESTEIRDTIHAILASLTDAKPAPQSGSSSKGKEKAVSVTDTEKESTSRDVAHSFDVVHTIEAAFNALERDFEFPSKLDLDSGSSAASQLAYTANNHPIKYYEQSLTNILIQLDQIDSFGNEQLRGMRKDIVGRVERALEDLEKEVEGRWRAKQRKDQKEEHILIDEPESQAQVPQSNADIPSEASESSLVVEPASESLPVEEHPASELETEQKEQESTVVVEQEQSSDTLSNPSQIVEPSSDTVLSTYPPASTTTAIQSETEPSETVSTDSEAESEGDTFLLSAVANETSTSRRKSVQSHDADSDWSEVDA